MSYTLSFELPGLPNRPNQTNAKGHWARYKESKEWHEAVALVVGSRRPPAPLECAKLTLVRHSSVCPDPDGLVGSFKYVVDALVKHGVIINDKISTIGMPDYYWMKCKPKAGKIQVTVQSVEGGG